MTPATTTTAPTTEPFDPAERAALLEGVREFRRREIEPRVDDPLERLTPLDLADLAEAARTFGLLASDADAAGALWARLDDPGARSFSVASLRVLAEADAAVALHLHELALGEALARDAGLERVGVVAAIHGRHGLARHALARFLAGEELADRDVALLAEHLPVATEPAPLLVHAGEGWSALVRPCFDADARQLRWQLHERRDLVLRELADAHGLEGVVPWRTVLGPLPQDLGPDPTGALLVQALLADALALVAIGTGVARHACRRARRYTLEREQGGVPIHQHPAVGLHLAGAAATVALAEFGLETVASVGGDLVGLRQVLGLRARLQPQLAEAVSAALQVHGGYGYMRDYGLERLLRDAQHLKLLGGTPSDLLLFLATHETHPALTDGGRR